MQMFQLPDYLEVIVRFQVKCCAPYGARILVAGSSPSFGEWDHKHALRLYWQEGNVWRGSAIIRGINSTHLEYKYLFQFSETQKIQWEEGSNRTLDVQDCYAIYKMDLFSKNLNNTFNQQNQSLIVSITENPFENDKQLVQAKSISHTSDAAIVVLGKKLLPSGEPVLMLIDRVRASIDLYSKLITEKNVVIVMTGGKVQQGENVASEAEVMRKLAKDYLEQQKSSLNPDIVLEDQALNTIENALNTKQFLQDLGIREIYLITSDFHMNRSLKIFHSIFHDNYKITPLATSTEHSTTPQEKDKEERTEKWAMNSLKSWLNDYTIQLIEES